MNWFPVILGVIRLLNFISDQITLQEAQRQVLADELVKLNRKLKITAKIIAAVEKLPIDAVDEELGK